MQFLTLGSFVFFTGLVGLLTWFLTRKDRHDTTTGYFLGGRTLTGGYIAGSLLLTNLSTEQLVGLNGAAFEDGLSVIAWEVIAAMSLVVMALIFLPKYLRSGIATIPQFLELRFDHNTRAITSIIFIVAYAGILLPIVLYTGATGLNSMLDVHLLLGVNETTALWVTVWVIGIIGSIYAIFGGLRTVAVSDTINGFGLLVGGLLITWFALCAISPDAPLDAFAVMQSAHPEKFNSLASADQSVPFSTLFTGVLLLNLFYWCTNQQIIQRTFGASSLKEGQKGVLMAGFFKILAPLILVIPGIAAFHLYGFATIDGQRVSFYDVTTDPIAAVGVHITDDEINQTIIHGQQFADLINVDTSLDNSAQLEEALKWETKSVDYNSGKFTIRKVIAPGVVITYDKVGQLMYHEGFSDDELRKLVPLRRKDKAYGTLVRNVLPPYLTGFFAAAIIGAILSSFNSGLNSTATLFSLGVYQHILHPTASEKRVINSGKVFGLAIAVFAMTTAPLLAGQDSIFGYLQKMNGLYFIPIFSVVIVGMASKKVPAVAANVALIVGFTAIALGYFVPSLAIWVERLNGFHFLGLVFISLILLMMIIGNIAPRKTPWVQVVTNDIDLTPWKPAIPVGIVLVLIVVGIYITFADISVI
ncbi:MAG: solute:sodium symporter family transporter [Planctomycetaceae bacterium]|nr:solute:sodium symporter family transporter [Planctomycetaceae bacterium]